jgi:hypothetical protein
MNWIDWIRKQLASKGPGQTPPQAQEADADDLPDAPLAGSEGDESEAGGLNFYTAIATHQRWKNRLKAYVVGESSETLDPGVIGRYDACALGQWLESQPNDSRIPPESMANLKQEHAQFHALAADIVRLADQGLRQQALDLLRSDAPYSRSSHRVTAALSRIYFELSEFHKPPSFR